MMTYRFFEILFWSYCGNQSCVRRLIRINGRVVCVFSCITVTLQHTSPHCFSLLCIVNLCAYDERLDLQEREKAHVNARRLAPMPRQ